MMQSRVQNKVMDKWWVYRDVSTGRWTYATKHPGERHGGIEGPMNYTKAHDRAYVKNKEVET